MMAYERPHEDRLGNTGGAGKFLSWTGTGEAAWDTPTGTGGGGLTIEGPYAITDTGDSDVGLTLAEGDIILQAFAVTKTAPSAPIDGDELEIQLIRDAGGTVSLTNYDLFNSTQTNPNGSAYFGIGLAVPADSGAPNLAYIDSPKQAVIRADACHIGVSVTIDSADGTWDVYVVMLHA